MEDETLSLRLRCHTGSNAVIYFIDGVDRFCTARVEVRRINLVPKHRSTSATCRIEMMPEVKYYDNLHDRPVDLDSDGCDLSEWEQLQGQRQFAVHPKGFRIFLPPLQIAASDEYCDSDPYTVEENIDKPFHKRRIELTIDLVRMAVSASTGTPEILDLGCGEGHISEKLRQQVAGAKITGLDYSISAIEYAHEHFPEIDFAVGDAYNSPYAAGYFDVVVCNNLWEHVPDPLLLLSRIGRMLKPGGHLVVSTPSRYRLINLVRVLTGKRVVLISRHHVTEYTVGQMKELLFAGKFDIKKVLSRPISAGSTKAGMVRWALSKFISIVGSHHQLEATVFYLAQKREN